MASIDKMTLNNGKTVRYVVRYETITPQGRRKQLTKRFAKAKEAQDFLVSTVNAIKTGSFTMPEKITVAQWIDRWFGIHKQSLQETTCVAYEVNLKKIREGSLGSLLLQQLRTSHIEAFYNELRKTLSGETVLRVHANLHSALEMATRDGYIPKNPSSMATLPKREKFRPAQLSGEDVGAILKHLEDNQERYVPARVAADSGLRRSEVIGLKWDAVDFATGTIRVQTVVVRSGKRLVEKGELKNETSYRALRMPPETMETLKKHKAWQAANKLRAGGAYNDQGWICTDSLGNRLTPDKVYRSWQNAARSAGYEGVRFHDLRHANITFLLSNGMPIQAVSRRAGHSLVSTTTDIYAHVLRGMDDQAAELLSSYTNTKQKVSRN